jgi:hypothetical protein
MVSNHLPAEQSDPSVPADTASDESKRFGAIKIGFCLLVLLLAIYQFSENTVDPDLWGHVIFGRHMLKTGTIPKTEIYSWTAAGQPWVNHECLAEVSLGGAHALLGGGGLLLLKVVVGLLTFLVALRISVSQLSWPARFVAWGFAAVAVVEISYGFAARPQIFTALALALELWLLAKIHAGARRWAWALPVLFGLWINTHGGVLAGFGLLGLAAGMTTLQFLWHRFQRTGTAKSPDSKTVIVLWLGVAGGALALLCNPWKAGLIRWLIGSILWLRPEIAEWNPTPFGWDHAALFILLALAVFAWTFTRRPRVWWELAACAAFALLALRSVRNAPLCGVVLLALVPPHLADAFARFRQYSGRLELLWQNSALQNLAIVLLFAAGIGTGVATFTLHKEHPLTMEVPRTQYPVGAVDFLRDHEMRGPMLVFFDWGEMVIFHLPDCPPSMDGRLDTCYSRELIAAHWKFYNDEPYDKTILDPEKAELALLPVKLAGAAALAKQPGWRAVYFDDTAVILARNLVKFPRLGGLQLPVEGPKTADIGRAAFADQSPRWKAK